MIIKEERVCFTSGVIRLEGRLSAGQGRGCVVITHPHPQMGGSMENNVVEAIRDGFHAGGYTTLRFNFRGVGRSEGQYDDGQGEQEDILAAVDFLGSQGLSSVILAGYSFGAWVIAALYARMAMPMNVMNVLFVSPPLDLLKVDFQPLQENLKMVICGDLDQFCGLPHLKKNLQEINCPLHIISGADHFYFGFEKEIIITIKYFLENLDKILDFEKR